LVAPVSALPAGDAVPQAIVKEIAAARVQSRFMVACVPILK
jgi:hypothetical protein